MSRNSKGFTLIEMMVVIGIIVILAGVGSINILTQLPARNLSRAARDIVSDFRRARALAVKLQRPVAISFSPAAGLYTVDGTSAVPQGYSDMTDYYGSGVRFGYPGRSDAVTFTDDTVTFNAMGMASVGAAGQGYAYLQNAKGGGYRVGVRGLAGNIVLEQCGADGVDCTAD